MTKFKLYNNYNDFSKPKNKGTSIAIGNFDGVHIGHKSIVETAIQEGKSNHLITGIFTFRFHPKNILNQANKIDYIIPTDKRIEIFKKSGVDFCIMNDVKADFFNISSEDFIKDILINTLNAKFVTVGRNFRFGKNASGNIETLLGLQDIYNFRLMVVPVLKHENSVVSSTRIRELIHNSEFHTANKLLGRIEFFSGIVVSGNQIGSKIGFPTANINFTELSTLNTGVYGVRCWFNNKSYYGVMNIGYSPTFSLNTNKRCEVHLLDFESQTLYNKEITLQIIKKIREEKAFSSVEDLVNNIKEDILNFRNIIKSFRG